MAQFLFLCTGKSGLYTASHGVCQDCRVYGAPDMMPAWLSRPCRLVPASGKEEPAPCGRGAMACVPWGSLAGRASPPKSACRSIPLNSSPTVRSAQPETSGADPRSSLPTPRSGHSATSQCWRWSARCALIAGRAKRGPLSAGRCEARATAHCRGALPTGGRPCSGSTHC